MSSAANTSSSSSIVSDNYSKPSTKVSSAGKTYHLNVISTEETQSSRDKFAYSIMAECPNKPAAAIMGASLLFDWDLPFDLVDLASMDPVDEEDEEDIAGNSEIESDAEEEKNEEEFFDAVEHQNDDDIVDPNRKDGEHGYDEADGTKKFVDALESQS